MDMIKLSTDWARAEVFSAKIVWLFSVVELLAAIGFWYWGRTTMAKAFTWPLLVMALFLISVGAGLYLANHPRIAQFENDYRQEPQAFLEAEIQRTSNSQQGLALVFRILPAIIIVAAIVIMLDACTHLARDNRLLNTDRCLSDGGGQQYRSQK
jgi:ABC-2 type transport system permease protein